MLANLLWIRQQLTSARKMLANTLKVTIAQVKEMILENHQITIRKVADDVARLFGSCQACLLDVLGIKRVTASSIKYGDSFYYFFLFQ